MPEAAEVETLARQLATRMPFRIDAAFVSNSRSIRAHPVEHLGLLAGCTMTTASRYGKWLIVSGDHPHDLIVHLRMSGRLWWDTTGLTPLHGHVRFDISTDAGPASLWFIDPRTFGEIRVVRSGSWPPRPIPDIASGPSPDWQLTPLRCSRRTVKAALLDQRALVAGVGNYLSDEICHRIGVHPGTPIRALDDVTCTSLSSAIPAVYSRFAAVRGTSLADETWRDLHGRTGAGSSLLNVHTKPQCGTCGGPVDRLKIAGRGTSVCLSCQPIPDNLTVRLLAT